MSYKVLITTPDYPPQRIGGISTYVLNIEKVLESLKIEFKVFVWNSLSDLKSINLNEYSHIINAHFHALLKLDHPQMLTIVHGGELYSYSKNPFKKFLKSFLHKKILHSLTKSKKNIFVSEFSYNLFSELYGARDVSRDFVFHNCIDLGDSYFIEKNLEKEIHLCCFVRDVPHKNIAGTIELYKNLKKSHPHKVTLTITSNIITDDEDIISIPNATDEQREEVLKKSHLNILLSLDHGHIGNIEGFGLTVLEAGKYGVPTLGLSNGGLVESIHHLKTGVLIDQLDELYSTLKESYEQLARNVYDHTHMSHGLTSMERFLKAHI